MTANGEKTVNQSNPTVTLRVVANCNMLHGLAAGISALLLLISIHSTCVNGIIFDLNALPDGGGSENQQCFYMYIGKDVMFTGYYKASDGYNQQINVEFKDDKGNLVYSKVNAQGKNNFAFTSHFYSDYSFCFRNVLDKGASVSPNTVRTVEFDVRMGADAQNDEQELMKKESLKPIEAEFKVLEKNLAEIVSTLDYMKRREMSMRDTNESTNSRVQWFSLLSVCTLLSSGLWQIFYLRQFFKTKKLM